MQAAISANVRIGVDELQETIGRLVVTTTDQLKGNQLFEAAPQQAMAFRDEASKTIVFLADRIPAGQEPWVFLRHAVLPTLRQEQPENWAALVDHLRGWGSLGSLMGKGASLPVQRVICDEAAARVAYLRLSGADAQEALLAFAVEAAAIRGVQPEVDAPYGSAGAWLREVVADLRSAAERLVGNDLPDFEGKVLPAIAQSMRPVAAVVKAEASAVPARVVPDRAALYQAAKQKAQALRDASQGASRALNEFIDQHGRGPMGLTPDSVKVMPEYKRLDTASAAALRALQDFNKGFVKDFAKERAADRSARFSVQVSSNMPVPVAVAAPPNGASKEQILERRVAVLTRQLFDARSAIESLVSPMNSGMGWLSNPDYKDDVTDIVGGVFDGPSNMSDALWEIKALAEMSMREGRSGKCSSYDVMELVEDGLGSAMGTVFEEQMLTTLQRAAQVNIERGDSMGGRELISIIDQSLFPALSPDAQPQVDQGVQPAARDTPDDPAPCL